MKKILLVCIGLLAVLIYVWSTYNHRKAIVTTGKPIQNYSVLEIIIVVAAFVVVQQF